MIIFDIETGPLPLDSIRHLLPPFDGEVGEFDPAAVKCGNLKDPAKIAEKIELAAAAHSAALASVDQRRAEHEAEWHERCALSPLTGGVVAIGVKRCADDANTFVAWADQERDERQLIELAWQEFAAATNAPFVGHNILGFDLPFLIRRSWLLEIDVPSHVRNGRYWSPIFVDLMDVWQLGSRGDYVSLDTLAKACGLAGKPDGVNGGAPAATARVPQH